MKIDDFHFYFLDVHHRVVLQLVPDLEVNHRDHGAHRVVAVDQEVHQG